MNDTLNIPARLSLSRRVVVSTGVRFAYTTPLISSSFVLSSLNADSANKISHDPGDDDDTDQNEGPVAVVGDGFEVVDEDGDGVETVTVDGSASTDSDGTITSYLWTLGGEWLSSEATAAVTLPIGTHRLILTVTDDKSSIGESTLRIRIKAAEGVSEPTEDSADSDVPPPPPFNVEAIQKFAEVALTWLVEDGITPPYRVYRTIDDGLFRPTDELDWQLIWEEWEQVSWRDSTVEVGIPYLYVVRTFDGIVESKNSNVVAITLEPVETEPEPTDLPPDEEPVEVETATAEVPVEQEVPQEDQDVEEIPPTVEAQTDPIETEPDSAGTAESST